MDRVKEVKEAFRGVQKKIIRDRIINEGKRIDGRGPKDIRALSAEVGLLPRAHGTGLFQRGETQALSIATLAMPRMEQFIGVDELLDKTKRYMHNYNMPPYSTGEAYPLRAPSRRAIGHGALAEKAVLAVLPSVDEFPYAIRVVSELLESNGSTSMASVCGSCLCLMDAGVPLTDMVGGIAMGLITEGDKVVTLTDIIGAEDGYGDMDFKVAGNRGLHHRAPARHEDARHLGRRPARSDAAGEGSAPRDPGRDAQGDRQAARRDVAVRAADPARADPGGQDRRDHRPEGQDDQRHHRPHRVRRSTSRTTAACSWPARTASRPSRRSR